MTEDAPTTTPAAARLERSLAWAGSADTLGLDLDRAPEASDG